MPYVTERWLGGMLTNFQTVHKRLQRLKELEELDFDVTGSSGLTKKELLMRKREMEKLQRSLGGVRDMARVPSAVWIVDTKKEHLAVDEARKLNIPIVAVLDTNCDPDEVTYPIPGNDDAIRAVTLLTRVVADAVADGLMTRAGQATADEAAGPGSRATNPWPNGKRNFLPARRSRALKSMRRTLLWTRSKAVRLSTARTRPRPPTSPSDASAVTCPGHDRPPSKATRTRDTTWRHDMANVTAAEVKRLRDATGAGMMDAKKALEETDGEFDQATELLRIKGAAKAAKRGAERTASNGLVAAEGTAMIELACETDFVAKNADFQQLAGELVAWRPRLGHRMSKPCARRRCLTAGRWPRRSSPPRRSSARRSSCVESPCSTGRSCRICTAGPVTCHRRSACWWNMSVPMPPRPAGSNADRCHAPAVRHS